MGLVSRLSMRSRAPTALHYGIQRADMRHEFASHFGRNPDASWTCTSAATLNGPNGCIQVAAGSRFYPGTIFMDFDIARWLEDDFDGRAQPAVPLASLGFG